MYSFWAMYSLRISFCRVPPIVSMDRPFFSARAMYMAQIMAAGPVYGHGRGNPLQGDVVEKYLHVRERGDGNSALAELTGGLGSVGVVAVEGGHVEGYA